ncbi:LOW QUALITY PROTEIN: hypothetical protein Ct61P_14893 [Colletotrichum tofieldiae]|nr:LOW QUALITY PROTEIN: hypothetical protein Ct61P_14893 [Colletotrichum tofieldiae]
MTPASTYEVLHRIDQTFSHVQYAVCGTAAMLSYGNNARPSTHVSIMCPAYAQDVIKSWAAATSGMLVYPGEPNIIGVADVDGDVWKVKIKPIVSNDNFRTLSTVRFGFGNDRAVTNILTMPALVNQIAVAYVLGGPAAKERNLDTMAGDLIWLLKQICNDDRAEQKLTTQDVPAVGNPAFWLDFTTAYAKLPGLFYDAGFRAKGAERSRQSQVVTLAQPNHFALQKDCSERRTRPPAVYNPKLYRRLREGPNMTRAELRKVMSGSSSRRRQVADF